MDRMRVSGERPVGAAGLRQQYDRRPPPPSASGGSPLKRVTRTYTRRYPLADALGLDGTPPPPQSGPRFHRREK